MGRPSTTTRFRDLTAAAEFYGIGRGRFFEMKKLGDEVGDPLPVEDPVAMMGWFERMQMAKHRLKGAPEGVLARATEEGWSEPDSSVSKAADSKDHTNPDSAELASVNDILVATNRLYVATNARYTELTEQGKATGSEGQLLLKQRTKLMEEIRVWTRDAAKLRESENYISASHAADLITEMFGKAIMIFGRELTSRFPPGDYERVMAAIHATSEHLPDILPKELTAA